MTCNAPVETRFTTANAREMAARANEAKRHAALLRANGEPAKPLLPEEKFRLLTLSRVRKQMDKVFEMMDGEEDAQKIDRLASALARLNEAERQLSNRSLPPSQKPVSPGKQRRSEPSAEPLPAEPAPTPAKVRINDPNEPNG